MSSAISMPPPSLSSGLVIGGRFRLEKLLGKGAMGRVWVAHHMSLHVDIALKFIDSQYAADKELVSRFGQEATAAAKIRSPHVVSILDHGVDEVGRRYIAMELLPGETLAACLAREATLELTTTARALTHACNGLTKAHAKNVVHRDIKPENLFLCREEGDDEFVLKILDFGIAKAGALDGVAHHTRTGALLGTPLYMSPEQALGNKTVDYRSDLYSVAVVAYRCLTGRVPFESVGLGALVLAIATETPPPPSQLNPNLAPPIDAWFCKALQKDPSERYQSAKELAESFLIACNLSMSAVDPHAAVSGFGGSHRGSVSHAGLHGTVPISDGSQPAVVRIPVASLEWSDPGTWPDEAVSNQAQHTKVLPGEPTFRGTAASPEHGPASSSGHHKWVLPAMLAILTIALIAGTRHWRQQAKGAQAEARQSVVAASAARAPASAALQSPSSPAGVEQLAPSSAPAVPVAVPSIAVSERARPTPKTGIAQALETKPKAGGSLPSNKDLKPKTGSGTKEDWYGL